MNEEPIRVLQVIGSMNRGGAEAMIMNLYRNIDRTKVQFDFLVHTDIEAQYDKEIKSLGGRIYSIIKFNGINVLGYYNSCKAFFANHPEYKIVHGHIGSCAAFYLKAAKKSGCYTIAHSHSVGGSQYSLHDLLYRIYSFPTRYIADLLIGCSSEAGKARFGKKVLNWKNYINFPNAVDIEQFKFNEDIRSDVRKELGLSNETIVVGTVGRITQPKNPEFIAQVFLKILSCQQNAVCLWVGTGELERKVKEIIESKHDGSRIIMTGLRSDVYRLLQAMDVFVFPSLWEGLPVTVVEAQAAGLPVVLSDSITKEVEVSSLLEWHSVNEPELIWAKSCLEMVSRHPIDKRVSPIEEIAGHGYDIKESAKYLQNRYLSIACGEESI